MRHINAVISISLAFSFAIIGCNADSSMRSQLNQRIFPVKRFDNIPTERADRLELEKTLIKELMAAALPDQRPVIQELIVNDPEAIGNIQTVKGSAKVAELIGRIYSLREANYEESQRSLVGDALAGFDATVTLVLVRGVLGNNAAQITRAPGPLSTNVIALEDAELTPERLSAALLILGNSRLRHGERPTSAVRATIPGNVRTPPISANERTWATGLIAELRSMKPTMIPEYGIVPSLNIKIGRR